MIQFVLFADPLVMSDEKLVCTVCSVSLAKKVREGADIFEHRFLSVLLCEVIYDATLI